jgi:hypothetical protein
MIIMLMRIMRMMMMMMLMKPEPKLPINQFRHEKGKKHNVSAPVGLHGFIGEKRKKEG